MFTHKYTHTHIHTYIHTGFMQQLHIAVPSMPLFLRGWMAIGARHIYIYIYIYTHTHKYLYIYIYIHIHTYIQVFCSSCILFCTLCRCVSVDGYLLVQGIGKHELWAASSGWNVCVYTFTFTFTQFYFRHKQINQKRSKSCPDPIYICMYVYSYAERNQTHHMP